MTLALLAAMPVRAGEPDAALTGADPDSWGSYRGLRVPSGGGSRVARSYLPTVPKSSLSVDSASANNEGGVVTFHYAPNFKDSKDQAPRSAVQPPVGSRSGLSFYGQLGDPRYGLKGSENLLPSDRVGGFIFDAQRDFRRYPGFSLGVGYDF